MKNTDKLVYMANTAYYYATIKKLDKFTDVRELYNDLLKIIDQAKSIVYDIEKLSLYDGDHETDPED